ncbi:MAG: cbb3-type cytochrome c oxidase subunit 3 [Gammaproteobacteria bacterium]|nr:cbb3-type cytochrome c oxidase subunit 3 [Gammaproteobacteria bacterium]
MDVNELRTVLLVLCFLVFVGIVYWAYSPKSKRRFEEAANLPFADDGLAKTSRLGTEQE